MRYWVRMVLASFVALILAGCTIPPCPAPTLSYEANGGTGLVSKPQAFPSRVAQVATTAALVREGYVFAAWNTNPDGTGQDLAGEVLLAADTVLYAQWQASSTFFP